MQSIIEESMESIIKELHDYAMEHDEVWLECEVMDELANAVSEKLARKAVESMTDEERERYLLSALASNIQQCYINAGQGMHNYGTPEEQLEELCSRLNGVEMCVAISEAKREIIKD